MDYKSKRWKIKRQAILTRDRFQCRECRRFGLMVNAAVVHHAYPTEEFPEFSWDDWNLVSLCVGCHNAMHDRDTGALTDLGLSWRRRVSPPHSGLQGSPIRDRGAGLFPTAGNPGEGVPAGTRAQGTAHT